MELELRVGLGLKAEVLGLEVGGPQGGAGALGGALGVQL